MRVALKRSISFHAYVTAIVRWLSAMWRVDPSQLRHTNSTEEEIWCFISEESGDLLQVWDQQQQKNLVLAPNPHWLAFLNTTMQQRYYFKKKDGGKHTQTHTCHLSPPHLSSAAGCKKACWCFSLIYANPILQFSHNGVLLSLSRSLARLPTLSARPPSQEFL